MTTTIIVRDNAWCLCTEDLPASATCRECDGERVTQREIEVSGDVEFGERPFGFDPGCPSTVAGGLVARWLDTKQPVELTPDEEEEAREALVESAEMAAEDAYNARHDCEED